MCIKGSCRTKHIELDLYLANMASYAVCHVVTLWMLAIRPGISFATVPGILQDICIMEKFEGNCQEDRVILMGSAYFGRKQPTGRCVPAGSINPTCALDVTNYLDELCSGRPTCSVAAADEQLFASYTCPQDFIPYLEVYYDCIPVLYDRQHLHECHSIGAVGISGLSEGIIASYFVFSSRTGSELCPWIIEVSPGQRINITLIDFGWRRTPHGGCHRYVEIMEETPLKSTSVCSGTERERTVYVSNSERVELHFDDYQGDDAQSHFILEYTASGCPDPILHGNILLERSAGMALLQCKSTGKTWSLQCVGSDWSMEAGSCEPGRDDSTAQGLVIIIIIIATVTVSCLCLLGCLVYHISKRRSRTRHPPSQSVYYEPRDLQPKVQTDYDWNSGLSFEKAGSQTYDRKNAGSAHYTHVWKPVNTDVMILETPEIPQRVSSLHNPESDDRTLPNKTACHQDDDEHDYETPSCRC